MNFEKKFLQHLKLQNENWRNGDKDEGKTAEFVNDQSRVVIEFIKPQKEHDKTNFQDILNNSKGYAKSAHQKFEKYKDYQTILLIKYNKLTKNTCQYLIKHLQNSSYTEIGAYLILIAGRGYDSYFYAENPCAKKKRKMNKDDCKKYLNIPIKDLIKN